ncbi:Uncharacterised protein [Halioglobus japonicus]|nr:Uncharacterised protein [Halioglobus japonicus]
MSRYTHRKVRPLRIVAMLLRGVGRLLARWPLLLLVGFLISPIGPHLRVQYTYELRGTHRQMLDCDYLGSRGFVTYVRYGECPLITILDNREDR